MERKKHEAQRLRLEILQTRTRGQRVLRLGMEPTRICREGGGENFLREQRRGGKGYGCWHQQKPHRRLQGEERKKILPAATKGVTNREQIKELLRKEASWSLAIGLEKGGGPLPSAECDDR